MRRFDLGAGSRKKNSITKKGTWVLYFPYLRETPAWPIRPQSCMVGDVHDVITCAEFQIKIFMGYNFTGRRIFDFQFIFAWALRQCSANAPPVI